MPGNPPQWKLRSGARRPIPSHVDRSTIEKAAAGPAKEASDAGASSLSAWRERPSGGFVRATPVSEHTLAIQRLRAALLASTAALRRGRRVLCLFACLLPAVAPHDNPAHPTTPGLSARMVGRRRGVGRAAARVWLAPGSLAQPDASPARAKGDACKQALHDAPRLTTHGLTHHSAPDPPPRQTTMAARPQVSVYNTEGKAVGEVPLPAVLAVRRRNR